MNANEPAARVCVSPAVPRLTALSIAALLFAVTATAQSPANPRNTSVALTKFVAAINHLSPEVRRHLSRGMQQYLRYASSVANTVASPATSFSTAAPHRATTSPRHTLLTAPGPGGSIQVSNRALDSSTQGYTQNTTSAAWCGDSVVIGYEDSGAFLRSDPSQAFGVPISQVGVSYSSNAGKNFTDLGFLTPGTFPANALIGDPVVTCTSPTNFQYVSILNTSPDGFNFLIGPSISFSTDAGKTWSAPQQVVSLDGNTELADKPSLAVDPTNPRRLYITYTHFSFFGCVDVELVHSTDAGKTWSAPTSINSDCGNPQILMDTGSNVAVSPGGKVYVAYESFPIPPNGASFGNHQIFFVRAPQGAASFSAPLKVADVVPGGGGVYLNGPLQANDYPQLAVDRSARPSRGTIYITWADGRNHVVPDNNAPAGAYSFADVFLAKSTTLGASFKTLGAISPTPADFRGIGRDQFLPAIAVDNNAKLAVCYYDRRNDRANLRVDRYCSVSDDQGTLWKDLQISALNWLPSANVDPLKAGAQFDISEYDGLATDFLQQARGFFGSFVIEQGSNQDVVAKKF